MNVIDVIGFKGHEWQLLVPPLRWNRPKTELWLLVTRGSAPNEPRNFTELPVPVFTEWFVPVTFCGCDYGYSSLPCLSHGACDRRRERECENLTGWDPKRIEPLLIASHETILMS